MHVEVAKDGLCRFAAFAPCGMFNVDELKALREWCEDEASRAVTDDEPHTSDWLRATSLFLDSCIEEEVEHEARREREQREAVEAAAKHAERQREAGATAPAVPGGGESA